MSILDFSKKDSYQILSDLGVDSDKGLSSEEFAKRLSEQGANSLPQKDLKWWQIFLKQLKSPFIYLLIFAALLSFILKQNIEGLMIFAFIIINTVLGFFQEYRSENTVKLLKKYIKTQARIIRDGVEKLVDSEDLVVGDIVVLETGDKVSADLRVIEAYDLFIDESVLTGESLLISKQGEKIIDRELEYFNASNLCFSGTSVIKGKALAVVVATGKNTFLGSITKLTSQVKKVSDFEKGISRFSSFILKLVLITLVFVFVFNAFFKGGLNILELTIFSIALAISVIPEALPLVMTFSFSKGAMRLAKHKVVVKRLSSVEDLGNIDILCSDKTGTLTENKLQALDFYDALEPVKKVLLYANLAASRLDEKVEPFDIALEEKMDEGDKKDFSEFELIMDTPFDPARRRNNALVKKDKLELIVRGAPESLFDISSNLDNERIKDMQDWIEEQGLLGRRVLGVAKKRVAEIDLDDLQGNLIKMENDLEFLGMIAFADPIKKSVKEAIVEAQEAQVSIKIITGDNAAVAGAVAYQMGLVDDPKKVILGSEFMKLNKEERERALDKHQVFARVLPEQKFEIIKLLQERYSVGYLGDGINDAPALKAAGVSLVVNNATDIARETADIILLEKDLGVIVRGIKEGREIFVNSNKYIKATMASSFGNFYAVAIASLIIDFLPMLPLQILLLNLLSDFPMIAIATDNVDKSELLSPKKYQIKDIIIIIMILGILSTVFDFIFFALFYRISPEVLQTNWFIASVLTELAFLFSVRTKLPILKGRRPSLTVILLTSIAAVATVVIPFTAFGKNIFHFIRPEMSHMIWIVSIAVVYLICSEIIKLLYYRNKNEEVQA